MKKVLLAVAVVVTGFGSVSQAFANDYHHHHRECHEVRIHHHMEKRCH
ncbi:hypothetical protein P3T23_001389 [Paraburkholderia sp. GAS448]